MSQNSLLLCTINPLSFVVAKSFRRNISNETEPERKAWIFQYSPLIVLNCLTLLQIVSKQQILLWIFNSKKSHEYNSCFVRNSFIDLSLTTVSVDSQLRIHKFSVT